MPALLDLLRQIAAIPSDTAEHVKQKEKIYTGKFLPTLKRFVTVGDLWSGEAMQTGTLRPEQYAELLKLLKAPRKFDEFVESEWARAALQLIQAKNVSPFHWEIAYPHVFLSTRGDGPTGFDVVLGNPPMTSCPSGKSATTSTT